MPSTKVASGGKPKRRSASPKKPPAKPRRGRNSEKSSVVVSQVKTLGSLLTTTVCRLFGDIRAGKVKPLHRKVLGDWLKQGAPRNPDKTFDLFALLPWRLEKVRDRKGAGESSCPKCATTLGPPAEGDIRFEWNDDGTFSGLARLCPACAHVWPFAQNSELADELTRERKRKLKIENDVAEGKWLPADEVEQGRVRRITSVKTRLLDHARRLAPLLVGRDEAEIRVELERDARETLEEFAGEK